MSMAMKGELCALISVLFKSEVFVEDCRYQAPGTKFRIGDRRLKSLEAAWITDRQIEAARIAMTRHIKRGGKIWIRMFPDKPVTKKPAETRMGKGKGAPEYWVAVVKPGRILYEIEGVDEKTARDAMKLASQKLPVKTKFVTRAEQEGGAL